MGETLARTGRRLIFGGGKVGLMGVLADAALAAGGQVEGVIPGPMVHMELAHEGLTRLHVVASMHERKALMAELADAFVALPGGIGTLEELFETWTWAQLGIHRKPLGLLETAGFFGPLTQFLDGLTRERFMRPENRHRLMVCDSPERLIQQLENYQPLDSPVWLRPEQA
jgi:uncharacterized protein (TIGR00730 family)